MENGGRYLRTFYLPKEKQLPQLIVAPGIILVIFLWGLGEGFLLGRRAGVRWPKP